MIRVTCYMTLGVTLLVFGCAPDRGGCPKDLSANPSERESGVMWGGEERFAEARISRVAAECIAIRGAGEGDSGEPPTRMEVQIAVTATVQYQINDEEWFNSQRFGGPTPAAMFEALSASGVVLGSERASIALRLTGSEGTMSTTISGLSPEVAARVSEIRVRWLYGQ